MDKRFYFLHCVPPVISLSSFGHDWLDANICQQNFHLTMTSHCYIVEVLLGDYNIWERIT